MESLYLYLSPEALDEQQLVLFGVHAPETDLVEASIWDLRLDAQRQRRLLELDAHVDGALSPWTGPVKVREGWYEWDEARGDYRMARVPAAQVA